MNTPFLPCQLSVVGYCFLSFLSSDTPCEERDDCNDHGWCRRFVSSDGRCSADAQSCSQGLLWHGRIGSESEGLRNRHVCLLGRVRPFLILLLIPQVGLIVQKPFVWL